MNPHRCSVFVPAEGRASHPRFWHGSAVLSAGVDARPRLTFGLGTRAWTHWRQSRDGLSYLLGMPRKAGTPTFFTERTLAEYLAVSDRTIRNWIRRGELASYKLGAARRIDPGDVEDFLARHRDEAA